MKWGLLLTRLANGLFEHGCFPCEHEKKQDESTADGGQKIRDRLNGNISKVQAS